MFLLLLILISTSNIYAEDTPPTEPVLHVFTAASHNKQQLKQLVNSCEKNGMEVDIAGIGLPYKGNGLKLIYLKQYLKKIPDNDLVMLLDAYDVVVQADKATIIKKFLDIGADFVIAAECHCSPVPKLKKFYPESPTKFKYINAGTHIGYAWFLKKLVQELSPIAYTSDQAQITRYFLKHKDLFFLDYQCEIFFPLSGVKKNEVEYDPVLNQVKNLVTGTIPCVVHGCGKAQKAWYQQIYDQLYTAVTPDENN